MQKQVLGTKIQENHVQVIQIQHAGLVIDAQLQGKKITQHAFSTNYAKTAKPKIIFQKQVKHTNALSESFTKNTNEKLSKIYDN